MLHELCISDLSGINIKAFLSILKTEQPDDFNYVINLRDEQRYTALHTAIFSRNIEAVKVLVEFGGIDIDAKCHGVPPLHLAISTAIQPGGQEFGYDCFNFLIKNNANISLRDDRGFSIIHLAAEYNLSNFLEDILKNAENAVDLVNLTSKLQNLTPLHRAASTDADLAAVILIKYGANILAKTSTMNMSALHIAGEMGSTKVWGVLVNCYEKLGKASSLVNNDKDNLGRSPREFAGKSGWLLDGNDCATLLPGESFENLFGTESSKTSIITNPFCIRHHTCPPSQLKSSSAPPENIKRIQILVDDSHGVLNGTDLCGNLSWIKNSKLAAVSDVLRVHEWTYVRKVQEYCANITSSDPEEETGFVQLDGDTAISKDSFTAALAAAGSVCQGIDEVMNKHSRNVFCAIRPPGHHAGPKGVVKGKDGGPDSHGFCILNNVSIGASYAMNRYRDDIQRVAIVDFDVHHGNGTEETVRWLKPDIEEHDFSKCSGDLFGVFYSTKYKPWFSENDSENVLFVSVHGYGPRERGLESLMPQAAFYPGSGKTSIPKIPPSPRYKPKYVTPIDISEGEKNGENEKLMESLLQSENEEEDDVDDDSTDTDDDGILSEQNYSVSQIITDANLCKQIQNKKRIFSSFATNLIDKYENSVSIPPLILDIGVELPDAVPDLDDQKSGGKMLSELSYRIQWRKYFREEIFPRLIEFQPDFIFISAGFDAHKKDTINGGYIALVEEDFEWVTQCLVNIANSCCNGRIVSVLEGGYQLGGEYCSAFAQSAKAHVRSLAQGTRSRAPFSISESQGETFYELQHLNSLKELRQAQIQRNEQRKLALAFQRQQEYESRSVEQQDIQNINQNDDSISTGATKANEISNEDKLNKKRRRQQVDYAALDKELRETI